jgi:hypothetical protein
MNVAMTSRMDQMRRLVSIALLACTSCAGRQTSFHDSNMDFGSVRAVAVLPFQNLSQNQGAGERVREVFSTMLLATGAVYVVPTGEVTRAIARNAVVVPATPSVEEVVKLGQALKVEAIVTGVVKEYGETRSGSATSNVVSLTAQMLETATGKTVWAASTSKGGVTLGNRLFGTGGPPLNQVTEAAVDDLINSMFK